MSLMSCRLTKQDERIRKWWAKFTSRDGGNNLRKAVNFYLDYRKFEDLLKLLKILNIDQEEAIKRVQGQQENSCTQPVQPPKTQKITKVPVQPLTPPKPPAGDNQGQPSKAEKAMLNFMAD